MGEMDGEIQPTPTETRETPDPDERATPGPEQDTLKVPKQKRRRIKSPTPGSIRGRSMTPIRGRSQTPFTLYLTRRSATPTTWRSITPFLKREEREKTPFELGRAIKPQLICNKAVFDRALVMDITEPEAVQEPVRYITTDMSVIDRAAVMDVSNVEVIYVVEEYEEYEEYTEEEEKPEEEKAEEEAKKKKKKPKKTKDGKTRKERRASAEGEEGLRGEKGDRREETPDDGEKSEKKEKRTKLKKEKKEKSPSPKLSLKLEMGGGPKASKKMFEDQQKAASADKSKPPPKKTKSKLALQMEEQAKAAAKAAEEAKKLEEEKARQKKETFEERQKRLKAEEEERKRQEEEEAKRRAEEAAERAARGEEDGDDEAERATQGGEEDDEDRESGEEEGDESDEEEGGSSYMAGEQTEREEEDDVDEAQEEEDKFEEEQRRGSNLSEDSFIRPDPEEEEKWRKIAEEEGEEFMQRMRKFSRAQARSEKERDADWQKNREKARLPTFINFLTDRSVEIGHNVRLVCGVSGPDLSVKWFKDGKLVERDARHRINNNNNVLSLEIVNTQLTDSGEYACSIANTNDEVTSTCIVTIYEVFKDEPSPPTISLIRDFYHLHDDELTIECHCHAIPRPQVKWIKDAIEIKPSFKYTLLEEAHGVYKLMIYRPSAKDSGKYIFRATNESGEQEIAHDIEFVKPKTFHVHGLFHAHNPLQKEKEEQARRAMEEAMKSKEEADKRRGITGERRVRSAPEEIVAPKNKLKFATHLRDRIALEGATVKLACNVLGPDPAVRWLKDDKPIVWGPTVKNLSSEGKAAIEIVKATAENSGVYKCIAKNQYSEIDTSCYLKVYNAQTEGDEQEPMFVLPMRDVYHSSENDLIIDTKVRGNPRPTITWLKDEIQIQTDARVQQIEHLDGVCELIINKPSPKDGGNYTCVAENSLGQQKITHSVVVENLPASRRSSSSMSIADDKEAEAKQKAPAKGGDQKGKPPVKGKRKEDEIPEGGRRRLAEPEPSIKSKVCFVAYLQNRYLAEGSKVKLQAVIGGPDPQIKWLKNGANVPYGPRVKNMSRENLAVLEISNANVEDSGEYTIIARNSANEITSSAQLVIYKPEVSSDLEPMFTRAVKEKYHLNTNELILETHVRGQPNPTVTWVKDGVELQNSEKYQIIDHSDGTCELLIDKPTNNDSGKYVVQAESRCGKTEISHHVIFEGKESHIAENIHGVFHADRNLLKREKKEETGTEKEKEEEKGKKGKAKGKTAKEEPAPAAKAADVKPEKEKREKRIGVHFAANLTDRVVAEGSKVKLTCYVDGPDPQIRWFKDDQPVVYGPKVRQDFREGLCTLQLMSASESDSGTYKCFAKNNNGETSTTCQVKVYSSSGNADVPPTFTRSIKDTYHVKINELVLDCHVRGLPTPTITWVKDGVKIEPSDKYQQIDHEDGTCELIISDPIPYDSGKYTCQAENRVDKAEITHIVQLQAKDIRQGSPAREPAPKKEEEKKEVKKEEKKDEKKKKKDEPVGGGRRHELPPPPDPKKRLYFGNFLTNRTAPEGSNLRMSVYINGEDPQCRWFRNEQPIVYGPKSKAACQDGLAVLVLSKLSVEDSGEYKLVARNPESEIVSTCHLLVYEKVKEDKVAPVFTVGIKDNYYLNENELVLDCRVRGNPRPEIQWSKGNDIIEPGEKYQQLDQADGYCKLVINDPTEKDSDVYTCQATNEVSSDKISHTVDFGGREKFILSKTHGFFHRDPNKPHLANPLGDHMITIGGTLALTAEFASTSTPIDVQWLRNKVPLSGQANVKTFVDHGIYTLAIEKTTAECSGVYTCRASNAFGRIESNSNVHIVGASVKGGKAALFLSRPEPEMKIAVGDPFSISFRVQGEPKPKLIFMKGTKDITKSDRVSKEASDDYIRFTVHKAQISDSGTYFVVARNEHGTDRIFTTVTVRQRARSVTPTLPRWGQPLESYPEYSFFKNPPDAISSEPILVDSGRNFVSLSWGKSSSENSAPVIAYRVDVWETGTDGGAFWRELGVTSTNGFDAFNLKSGCEYHFRVTPRNRYGWGKSVQTSSPILIGGAFCLPEFVKILPGQMKALLDHECILECNVKGTPKPKVVWYKDGQPIESSDRVSIRQIGSICRLKITHVFEIDSGRYTCEATNNQGKVSTFARLQVVSDPKIYEADHKLKQFIENETKSVEDILPIFTMRLRDRRVQVTYPVRLTCQVVGYPQPELTWFKDGVELKNSNRWLICDDGQFNTLEIANTCLDDSGVYTATAKNELGSVSCHCSLIVDKGIRAYIAPDFYVPLDPVYTFKEGQEIRLAAKVEAYPSVGVAWHRNGIRLRPSRKIIASLDHDGFVELVIADATLRDAGIYSCVASNAVGRIESSCRVVIESKDDDAGSKQVQIPSIRADMPYSKEPMFVTKPRSSEAFEGDTVIIFCEVIGDPKPEVVWLRDFLKPDYYKDAPHFRRIGDGPEYRLEIPRAKLDFTGTYSVIAKNCHGDAKAIISLQIYAKDISKSNAMDKGSIKHGNVETLPCVIRHLKDLRCCDGDSITLECYVEGVPEPIILWEKDGRILPSGKDFVTSYDGTRATLSIKRVYPEDEGEYTCVASNNIGRAYSSACIIVDVPEEKENLLSRQLARPPGLLLSASSTPRSTPRTTPVRSISPLTLSYRHSSIDLTAPSKKKFAAPKFYAIPHSHVAEEGETVRFQCAIAGHPLPWSTWDKDGIIVTQTTRISIKERDDLRFLEIEEVTFDDAGLYRITLENDYGRIEATARLDVIGNSRRGSHRSIRTSSSPRRNINLSRRIMGNSTRIGGRLVLACNIRGSSVPARKFYHNGEEIKESERIHIEHSGTESSLIIDKVKEEDEGIYTCVAQNEYGLVSTSTSVAFFKSEADIPALQNDLKIVQELPKEVKVPEGRTTDLVFEIDTQQPYTYVWLKDKEPLADCDEFRYIDHGNGMLALRILDAFDMDSGIYTCIVKTQNTIRSTSCQLAVDENKFNVELEKSNLALLKHTLPAIGFQGTVLSFYIRVNPHDANVKWFVCGRNVKADSREFSLENQADGVRILHVLGVDYKHSGEVKVIVQHPITGEEITTYTDLTVLPSKPESFYDFEKTTSNEHPDVPAYIVQGPEDCTVLVGGTVKLEVVFGGYPIPTVKWLKAGRPISQNSNVTINTTKNQSNLVLTSITADESGKYTVEVMNEHSSDFAAASVAVEGPPEPPSGKPSVSQGPDRVAVAWCGPPYDGGCMLTGFIVEMQEKDKKWIEIATVVDSLAYTVKNLIPGSTYKFRVRAENIHGKSEPSVASEDVTIPIKHDSEEDSQHNSINIRPGGDFKTRFEVLDELGKGRFGVVYKVIEKEAQQILAAKVIKCIKSRDRHKVQEEISIMQSLNHPKLLNLAAAFENPREIIMVMEYITGGELFERVVADDFTLTERDCILFMRQICEGVDYMHSQKVVHLDLKPENIMCHTRTSHQIKIIDFGLAQRLTSDTPVRVLFGTPEFIPPEIINYEPISFQSDMWSVGVICYVLLSGLSPFMGDSDIDTFANITRADYDFDDEAFDAVSQKAKDFISSLLIHRKEERLTAKQCLESKWLSQHDENISNNKICTDKLKKFIIRRKWQKTGNAIRALGRMANLSASRRNSSASSLPNSPRPSISAGSSLMNHIIISNDHMSSLNEEEDNFDSSLLSLDKSKTVGKVQMSVKIRDKTQCSERSDSGFSECSSCSGGGNIACTCLHSFSSRSQMNRETTHQKSLYLSNAVSHELLKSKLEEIAEAQRTEGKKSEQCNKTVSSSSTTSEKKESSSPLQNFTIEVPLEHKMSGNTTTKLPAIETPLKEPIMMSDFTNTIKMRKKSLEKNIVREKVIAKTIFETSGKVSMLKSKFNTKTCSPSKNVTVSNPALERKIVASPAINTKQRKSGSKEFDASPKSKTVFDRLANNKTNAKFGPSSTSLPASPLPSRSEIRIVGRVKEVTERLSTPKKNNSSALTTMTTTTTMTTSTTARRLAQKLETPTTPSSANINSNNSSLSSALTKVGFHSPKKLNLQSTQSRS